MAYYWEPASIPKKGSSSNGTKIIAAIIILMVVVSTGLIFVTTFGPATGAPVTRVRVAVLDSGIDVDFSLEGRVVAEASFVTIENGYEFEDLTTTDARPQDVPHGTLIAKQLVATPNIDIVNGKVFGSEGPGNTFALIEAIEWAVEQNASVINLSLGGSPTLGDPLEVAINWAFSQNVIVVTSAGNAGDGGILGTTIESPALFDACIAVGALMEDDTPASFTSIGPTVDRYMKPDISAAGYTTTTDGTRYYGTSFASPRVAAAAAELIGHSVDNNITYTAGSIMTALMMGADPVETYPEYVVGAGKLNVQQSRAIILDTGAEESLPAICYAFPGELPIDYERVFASDTYNFYIRMFTSGISNFTTEVDSSTPLVFDIPAEFEIDQIGRVPVTVNVPESGVTEIEGTITFSSLDYGETSLHISFDVGTAIARVAFDISHTPWDIDSIYGQFREFYKVLVENDVSVTEIRDSSATTNSSLHEFDAVVILDPCAYSANETILTDITSYFLPFSENETKAYEDYYNSGGGIFVAALSNSSINITSLNQFLNWTGFSLTTNQVPNGNDPVLIIDIEPHIITSGINGFHYHGATISIPGDGYTLANYGPRSVLAYKEGASGGKLVITGSNFMLDNYGLLGQYSGADDNARLALRIVLWCAGMLI
ncbi:MAG: S8 family serine peptidase [Candidatus Thorarchaeota archaeon]